MPFDIEVASDFKKSISSMTLEEDEVLVCHEQPVVSEVHVEAISGEPGQQIDKWTSKKSGLRKRELLLLNLFNWISKLA